MAEHDTEQTRDNWTTFLAGLIVLAALAASVVIALVLAPPAAQSSAAPGPVPPVAQPTGPA